jgi:YfiH family protein
MISAPGIPGVVFGSLDDGDGRVDIQARRSISARLDISSAWATVDQVHGSTVVTVGGPGHFGEADGLITATRGLPIVVATADCVPVVLIGMYTVSIVHAGWRGVAAGIVPRTESALSDAGDRVSSVVIGPHIGPCCYEVGQEVIDAIGGHRATTGWGTMSADLGSAIQDQVSGVEIVSVGPCTMDDVSYASHRRDGTPARQIAIAWIP